MKTAIILGASGLVGSECLKFLLMDDRYTTVKAFVRENLPVYHDKLKQYKVKFDRIESYHQSFDGDDVFCCLGTTMARAGSQEAFYRVDHDYVIGAAELASQNGASQFLLISSMGADADSSIFYNKVKGKTELDLIKLPFKSIHIFRPSLILGNRNEFRFAERMLSNLSRLISPAMIGPLRKYKPIEAEKIGLAMVEIAREEHEGIYIFESNMIEQIYKQNVTETNYNEEETEGV